MNLHFVFPPQNLHLTQFFLRTLCLIFIPPDVRRTRFFLFVRSCIPPLQKCACPSLNAFQHTQLIQPLTSLYLPIYAYNRLLPPCVAKEKIGTLLLASEIPVPIPPSRTVKPSLAYAEKSTEKFTVALLLLAPSPSVSSPFPPESPRLFLLHSAPNHSDGGLSSSSSSIAYI